MAICGAKTRSGQPCQAKAMPNGRCRMHGGTNKGAPAGNSNPAKPGSLYSKYMTPEEEAIADQMEIGTLDDEIRLARIRLMRALKDEQEKGGEPQLEERVERDVNDNVGARSEEKYKTRDHCRIVDQLLARIESLEYKRQLLLDRQKWREVQDVSMETARADNRRAGESHELDVAAKRKAQQAGNGGTTHNIMPVPCADSVDDWEKAAIQQQDQVLGRCHPYSPLA